MSKPIYIFFSSCKQINLYLKKLFAFFFILQILHNSKWTLTWQITKCYQKPLTFIYKFLLCLTLQQSTVIKIKEWILYMLDRCISPWDPGTNYNIDYSLIDVQIAYLICCFWFYIINKLYLSFYLDSFKRPQTINYCQRWGGKK